MKKTIFHVVYVITILIISAVVLNEVYAYTFRNGIVRNKRQSLLLLQQSNVDILFLGSSRTESHIVDSIFEQITKVKVLNAGMERATLHDSYVVLYSLIKNGNQFKECWVQLDYTHNIKEHSANMFAEIVPFLNDKVLENHALEINQISSYRVPFQLYMQNDKIIGFREFFLKLINKKPVNDTSLKFKPLYSMGLEKKGEWPTTLKNNIAMDKIIALSIKNNFKIHFFTSPNCPQSENKIPFAKELKKQYKFKDYYSVFDDSLDYFYDCGHLNNHGAASFTRILARDYNIK